MKTKFFVAEVITYNNGTKDEPSIYTYDSEDADKNKEDAMARYHKDMGAWMNKSEVESVAITVFNNNNDFSYYDCHTKNVTDTKQIAIESAIATYKANPTDENLAKIKKAVTAE